MADAPDRINRRNLYGQRSSYRLRPAHRSNLELHLDRLNPANHATRNDDGTELLDLSALAPADMPVWLEIGFGSGEHLVHQARNNPDCMLIGCEVYIRGIAAAIGKIIDEGLDNVRIFPGDIRDLFDILPANSVSYTFLMYPDPWPKRRHHKRRFVNREYLQPLSTIMKPGSELRIATDIADFARQAIEQIHIQGKFMWTATSCKDWKSRWPDALSTRYEQKAINNGRQCHYLAFRRETP